MKITIDSEARALHIDDGGSTRTVGLYTKDAFEAVSREWTRIGWALRHYFTFTWQGLPVLQLPEDLLRLQEIAYRQRPDVIVETGVYQGGSLLFLATLCKTMDHGRVIGIDQHIPEQVRTALESHQLAPWISLIEGDSVSGDVVSKVRGQIGKDDSVLVLLDSDHSAKHVRAELEAYAPLVTLNSYLIATDGVMRDLTDVPGGDPSWVTDNPFEAATAFAAAHPEFEQAAPAWPCDESGIASSATYWPGAWLRRLR